MGVGFPFETEREDVSSSFAPNWLEIAMPADLTRWGITVKDEPDAPASITPDATLSDWRVALIDMGRFADVESAVQAAKESGAPEGLIAWQRFDQPWP